jgi:hypothetical protein
VLCSEPVGNKLEFLVTFILCVVVFGSVHTTSWGRFEALCVLWLLCLCCCFWLWLVWACVTSFAVFCIADVVTVAANMQ